MRAGYSYRMINSVDKERFQQTFAMSAKKHFGKEDYVSRCAKLESDGRGKVIETIMDLA